MRAVVLFCLPLALLFDGSTVSGFNIDIDDAKTFNGPRDSLFGFSVLGHQNNRDNLILVGAPNSTSECQPTLSGPSGALYRCSSVSQDSQSCSQVCVDAEGNEEYRKSHFSVRDKKEGQLLGMSLASQPGPTGRVVVCGHLWSNYYNAYHYPNEVGYLLSFPWGVCYSINAQLERQSVEKLQPCIAETRRSAYWYLCISGASAHFAVDGRTLMLGAPGAFKYQGSVVTVNGTQTRYADHTDWGHARPNSDHHQYPSVGYSLTSGHFSSLSAIEGVTGGPRYEELGRVYIFDLRDFRLVNVLTGEPVNTYFGASIDAVDLNNDGWSDLLVGAPLYSTKRDEGCVYVYVNDGRGELELQVKLKGSNVIGARFGSAVGSMGDLNKDGYADVAIGAPFEDDNSGAVYIYHGASYGISSQYSQRIPGSKFGLTGFGSSLSGALDLDDNSYPDLIVGAPLNDSVVYLRARPVVKMQASMTISPATLIIRNTNSSGTQSVTSTVTVCLTYYGASVTSPKDFVYKLQADYQVSTILQSRVYFGSSRSDSVIEEVISLSHGIEKCKQHTLTLKNNVKDFLNAIPIQLLYRLGNDSSTMTPVMNPAAIKSITKQIGFGRDCGADDVCDAALRLESSYKLLSEQDVIYLGADSVVYITAEVSNSGEEAHQARLTIRHPANVVYEAVETVMSTEAFNVKCVPISVDDVSLPYLECSIGNPLRSYARVSLQVRLDIGSLAPSQTELNISLSVSTSSIEMNTSDNQAMIGIPVAILADVTVKGASTSDQVVYKQDSDYSSPAYLKGILDSVKHLSASTRDMTVPAEERPRGSDEGRIGQEDQEVILTNIDATPMAPRGDQVPSGAEGDSTADPSLNVTMIGPNFVQQFEVANLGPGRIPYRSSVNISIPWRTQDGDWLIFITQVQGRDGVEACNTASVLRQQYQDILNHYSAPSKDNEDEDDGMQEADSKNSGPLRTTISCAAAQCVTLQCQIQPLAVAASAVIEVHARLWKHSFLKGDYGLVTMMSNMSVQVKNPQGLFSQPDEHSPDSGRVKVTVSAEKIQAMELPLPAWVIPVSTCAGILLLILMVAGLAKLGFFRRKKMEEMQKRLVEEDEKQSGMARDNNIETD